MYRIAKLLTLCSVLLIVCLPNFSIAADYQSMTTQELSALRGTMSSATQADRDAFRAEWLQRVEKMSPQEKEALLTSGPGRGKGNRSGSGLGDGSGRGQGGGQGSGNGNGNGNGNSNGNGNGK